MGSSASSLSASNYANLTSPRTRHVLKAAGVDDFFDLVAQVLSIELQTNPVPDGAQPFYVHSFPKERLAKTDQPFDGITWRVLSSSMAPTDNAGARIPRKPITLQAGPDQRAAGYSIVGQMWWELATAEFTIWSKSSDTRSQLVTWFHKFLMRYANVLKFFEGRGVEMFQFVGRGEDGFDSNQQQEVHFGTLTYQFRVQYLDNFTQRQLEKLTVNAQIDDTDQLTFSLPADAA